MLRGLNNINTKIIMVLCMNMRTRKITIGMILLIVIVIIAIIVWFHTQPAVTPTPAREQPIGQFVATALFSCDSGKTIKATFYAGTSTPSTDPDQPPTPGGSVALTLSDGRTMTLPHVISADGGRYATTDESIVFWNVGNTAFITENNVKTYVNCTVHSK